MKYWLILTNEENWEVISKSEIYGFDKKNKKNLELINESDLVVVYVIPKKIGGLFKIEKKAYLTDVNMKSGSYPNKIKLKKILIPKCFLEINDIIVGQISIFQGAIRWGSILMGRSIIELNKQDYKLIKDLLEGLENE